MARFPDWLTEQYIGYVEIQCASLLEYLRNGYPKRTLNRIKELRRWLTTIEYGIKEEDMHKGTNYIFEDEPAEATDWTEQEVQVLSSAVTSRQHHWHFYKQRVGHMTSYIATILDPNGCFQAFNVEQLAVKIVGFYKDYTAFKQDFDAKYGTNVQKP